MAKRNISLLAGAQVRLRLLTECDLLLTRRWRNQDHIRRWFFHSTLISAEQHQAWFTQYSERDDDFVFIIEEIASARAVGQAALYHVDWDAGRAELGRLMIGVADAAGKGLAREATALLVHHALSAWGLREVYLQVFAENTRAVALYAKCGFTIAQQRDNVLTMRVCSNRSIAL